MGETASSSGVLLIWMGIGKQYWSESDSLCRPDLEFINKMVDKTAIARLEQIATTPFERCTYTRAIEILEEVVASKKKKFEFPVCMPIPPYQQHLFHILKRSDVSFKVISPRLNRLGAEAQSQTQCSRMLRKVRRLSSPDDSFSYVHSTGLFGS